MRIAQIAPLHESVPPRRYGGTERVVHYLTEELVSRGHDVVLFASGDSTTSAELVPCVPQALRGLEGSVDPAVSQVMQLEYLARQLDEFDILHFHTGFAHFPFTARLPVPQVNTLHGPLIGSETRLLLEHFRQLPLVAISQSQMSTLPQANWLGVVYHALPRDLYHIRPDPGDYLAFVGRISPEKRLDRAIEVASATGLPLKVAAKVDCVDRVYFMNEIEPLLRGNPLVEFVGEVDDRGKQNLLAHARALLFPIDWAEPFGLVMIEANACGTPVVAWRHGSTSEVIHSGINGVLVETMDQAVAAVGAIDRLDRTAVRADFEARFDVTRQAEQYEQLYLKAILANRSSLTGQALSPGLSEVCHAP